MKQFLNANHNSINNDNLKLNLNGNKRKIEKKFLIYFINFIIRK
jgi:hypothetical protein